METAHLFMAHVIKGALLAAIVGLFVRGRARLLVTLPILLAAMLVSNTLMTLWPKQFFTAAFYIQKEAVYQVLTLVLAAELAWRVFRGFPGAMARARVVIGTLLAATTLWLTRLPVGVQWESLVTFYQPRIQTGAIWALTFIAFVALWYRLPIHALHRAVLGGLTGYLLVFVTISNVLREYGWNRGRLVAQLVEAVAFLALTTYLAHAAWRAPEDVGDVSPVVARRLRLEAA